MKVGSYGEIQQVVFDVEASDAIDLILEMTLANYSFRDGSQIESTLINVIENHRDAQVRNLAVVCLGHTGRIEGRIRSRHVITKLIRLRSDPELRGSADNALSDIWMNAACPLPISLWEQVQLFAHYGIGLRFMPWRLHWRKRKIR